MSNKKKLYQERNQYNSENNYEDVSYPQPLSLFEQLLEKAIESGVEEPNTMILSTISNNKRTTSRIVLLRELNSKGLVFYTNYNSQKAKDIEMNPIVSALFYWRKMNTQIRIEGRTQKIPDKDSDDYFASRPWLSSISAWASKQSQIIESNAVLLQKVKLYQEKFKGKDVPRPEFWGGYCIVPDYFEFWFGKPDRLHKRIAYTKNDITWQRNFLSP